MSHCWLEGIKVQIPYLVLCDTTSERVLWYLVSSLRGQKSNPPFSLCWYLCVKPVFLFLFLFFLWCLAEIEGLLSKCFVLFFSLLGSNFSGPLARESFCCGFIFCLCHLEFLIVSFFSIFGYMSQKENTGTHHCVFVWIPRFLFSLPSLYFSVLLFALCTMSRVFSCSKWDDQRKECLLHHPGNGSVPKDHLFFSI